MIEKIMKSNILVIKYLKLALCFTLTFAALVVVDIYKPKKNVRNPCYMQSKITVVDANYIQNWKSTLVMNIFAHPKILFLQAEGMNLRYEANFITFSYSNNNLDNIPNSLNCDETNKILDSALREAAKTSIESHKIIQKSKEDIINNVIEDVNRKEQLKITSKIEQFVLNNANLYKIIHYPIQTCPFEKGKCKIVEKEVPLSLYAKYISFFIFSSVMVVLYIYSRKFFLKNIKLFLKQFHSKI